MTAPTTCSRCGDKTARKTLAKFAGLCEPCDLKKGNPVRCPKCGCFILRASERTATRLRGCCFSCPTPARLLTKAETDAHGWTPIWKATVTP
jgi:hypothetical protein